MIRLFPAVFIVVSVSFSFTSCKVRSEVIRMYETSASTQTRSNAAMHVVCIDYYQAIEAKNQDHSLAEKAAIWYPVAGRIKKISDVAFQQLQDLRDQLTEKTHKHTVDGMTKYDGGDMEAAPAVLKRQAMIDLEKNLRIYYDSISQINEEINKEFENTKAYYVIRDATDDMPYLYDMPAAEVQDYFASLQGAMLITEYDMLKFCHIKLTPMVHTHSWPRMILNISSSNVKPGEKLTVTAGIGVLAYLPESDFIINGAHLKQDSQNNVLYHFKAPDKVGKYKLPVTITFTDENGNPMTKTEQIDYEVSAP